MKRLRLYAGISTFLILGTACSNPPQRVPFKPDVSSDNSLPDDAGQNEDPGSPLGSDIKDALTAEAYGAALRCDVTDTFRGLRSWRRLSNIEVQNTVADVFGVAGVDYSQLSADIPKKESFDTMNIEVNFVGDSRFAGYENFAKSLMAKVDINKVFPCYAAGASCMTQRLPDLIAAAWRRPAVEAEVETLVSLYSAMVKDGLNAETAARSLIEAVVLSHNFLYRSELGTLQADNSFALSDWELASALSYTLWRRPPNNELKQLAAAGALSRPDAIRPIAEKMMNDPLAKSAWKDFAGQWLDVGRINTSTKKLAPDFTADMKSKMVDEARDFVSTVMFDSSAGTFKSLMTADYTTADSLLDGIYGAKSLAGKTPFLQPERRGILGQSGFLSSHSTDEMSNPILRGAFVAERLLCIDFKGAPPTITPKRVEGLSTKEIFKMHNNAACASCHTTIDNLGFALENFDYMGRFRATDAGQPIVTDGVLAVDGKSIPITSPQQMMDSIAASTQAQQCFVREAFRFGFGRTEFFWRNIPSRPVQPVVSAQGNLDRCQIENATSKMLAKGGDLKAALIELVSTPAFRLRLMGVPETND